MTHEISDKLKKKEYQMYKFIEKIKTEYLVNETDIKNTEEKWNISFPTLLKEFYLNYNGAELNLCIFVLEGYEHEISEFIPLKYGECNFDDIIKNDREDGIISNNMIPLASNRGGDYYYWNSIDESIVLFYCDDIENPIYICKNIRELFELMENSLFSTETI